MRAYLAEEYGGPDVLRLRHVDPPRPSSGEVVIRVEATSIDAPAVAGLPVAGVTALLAIRAAQFGEAGRILVIGASGGVGTLVVQLAAARGARVTAVCSGRNADLVRRLGAQHVVDYTTGGLDDLDGPFDAVVDAVAEPPFRRRRALVARRGTYVIVGAPDGSRLSGPLGTIVRAKLSFAIGRRRSRFFVAAVHHDALVELVDAGVIRPVVDRIVDFESLPDAMRQLETHRARGKIIVDVDGSARPEAAP